MPPRSGGKIRFGLAGIKGVGEVAARKIIAEREAGGPYRGFHDFLLRSDARAINRRVVECLVLTGAFDSSGATREEVFEEIDAALGALGELQRKYPALRRDEAAPAAPAEAPEATLFDLSATTASAAPPDPAVLAAEFADLLKVTVPRRNGNGSAAAPAAAGHSQHSFAELAGNGVSASGGPAREAEPAKAERILTATTKLQYEKELLGFYISGHPMDAFAGLAEAVNTLPEDQLLDQPNQTEFRVCGVVTGIVKKLSRKDNRPWAAFTLATRRASLPLNMFAEAYEAYAKNLVAETPVLVQGTVLAGNDGARLNVRECYALAPAVISLVKKITWLLRPDHPALPDFLRDLRATVEASLGDTRLAFGFVLGDRLARVADVPPSLGWRLDPARFRELRAHPAVAGALLETKRLQLKETRRFARSR